MTDERRHSSRITFHAPAQLVLPGGSIDVVILDLSLKGALVQLPADIHVEEESSCSLHVHLDEMGDSIRMETRITHVEGPYAGLSCHSIDLDSVTHLRRLVALNLGSEELLERELSALLSK